MTDLKSPTQIKGVKNKGRILWGLLIFNAVGTLLVAVFLGLWASGKVSNQSASQAEARGAKEYPETSDAAVSFAIRFAQQYLYMTPGYQEDYQKRLQPFLAKGVDPQAGVELTGGKKYLIPHDDIQVWKVRRVAKNRSIITFQVVLYNGTKKDNLQRFERLLNVPIIAQGSSKFAVYDIPYFEPLPEKANVSVNRKDPGEPISNPKRTDEIQSFLGDFFKEYAEGSAQEISYKVRSDQRIQGLDGLMKFKEVKKVELFDGKGNQYIAQAEITFIDSKTGIQLTYPYELRIEKKGDQWFVNHLKHR